MESRENILLKMHDFYTREAQYQRSMMWETVKWFTPIIIAIHGSWWWMFLNNFTKGQKSEFPIYLCLIAAGGIALSFICLKLLKSFYRSNYIYISMFIKIEDELDFDNVERNNKRNFFTKDPHITYQRWRKDRLDFESSEDFIAAGLKGHAMYMWMRNVFHLFMIGFIVEVLLISLEVSFGQNLNRSQIFWFVLCAIGIYFAIWFKKVLLPTLNAE